MPSLRVRTSILLLALCVAACNCRPSVEQPAAAGSPSDEEQALRGMDEDQQAFLWEIEHQGNILSQVGFPALTKALRARDEEALARLLAPDFKGELPREPS